MQIIDAQVHLWSSGTPSGHHRQCRSYTAEELLAGDGRGRRGCGGDAPAGELGPGFERAGDGGGAAAIRTASPCSARCRSTSRTTQAGRTWRSCRA